MIINTTAPNPYRIGDIKLTTRNLDSRWSLCNGELTTSDIQDALIENNNFGYKQFTPSAGTYDQVCYFYIDEDYIFIIRKDNLTYGTTSGSRFISLDIYENLGDGKTNFLRTEKIYSGSTSRSGTSVHEIIKFDGYYWLLFGISTGNSSGITSQTYMLAYQDCLDTRSESWIITDPIAQSSSSSTAQYFTPCAFYSDEENYMRVDFSTNSTSSGYFDSYKIDSNEVVVEVTTYSTAIYSPRSWSTAHITPQNKSTQKLNEYIVRLNSGKIIYKNSFNGDWVDLPAPTTTSVSLNSDPYRCIWYFNGLYYALVSGSSYAQWIIASSTFLGLTNESNWILKYSVDSTDLYYTYIFVQCIDNYTILIGPPRNGTLISCLIIDKDNNISISSTNLTLSSIQSYGESGSSKMLFLLEDYNSSSTKWYILSTATPTINIPGVSAYIKSN